MQQIFVVRHGQTEWNVQERMQGRLDSPLTDVGKSHALANGALLRNLGGVDRIYSSSAGRTIETAHIINSSTQAPLTYVDELLERDSGEWTGLTLGEIEARYPESFANRKDDAFYARPPSGENLQDMLERVHGFLDELFDSSWQRICLVTHGVMSKVILKYYLDLTEHECVRLRHPNDLVYRLTFENESIAVHHFVGGGEPVLGLLQTDSADRIMSSKHQ